MPEAPMHAVLLELGPDGSPARHLLHEPGPILVGRGRTCPVRLRDSRVSRHHCLLAYRRGKWHIKDLGSANGVYVNNQRVQDAALADRDLISLGRFRLCLRISASDASPVNSSENSSATDPSSNSDNSRTEKIATPTNFTEANVLNAPRLLRGRYELGELIHEGSTGAFYRGRDSKRHRPVCLKLLSKVVVANESDMRRFVRGVRTAPPSWGEEHAKRQSRFLLRIKLSGGIRLQVPLDLEFKEIQIGLDAATETTGRAEDEE